jgi:hypothetical protein
MFGPVINKWFTTRTSRLYFGRSRVTRPDTTISFEVLNHTGIHGVCECLSAKYSAIFPKTWILFIKKECKRRGIAEELLFNGGLLIRKNKFPIDRNFNARYSCKLQAPRRLRNWNMNFHAFQIWKGFETRMLRKITSRTWDSMVPVLEYDRFQTCCQTFI